MIIEEKGKLMAIEKVIFMGTPEFAVPSFKLLCETRYKPILCITQPDKEKGRNRKLLPPVVKIEATNAGVPVLQPEDVNSTEIFEELCRYNPDLIVTVAYGSLLKKKIRKLPKYGCINLHPSLLPLYRGSTPINSALFNNDVVTGNTIFKINARMDAGAIITQSEMKISENDNFTTLSFKLSENGANELLNSIQLLESNKAFFYEQDDKLATYSEKITREITLIDWNKPAREIRNKVRGLAEIPGMTASFRGKRIKIIEVEIVEDEQNKEPGSIIEIIKNKGIVVATADKNLLIKRLQPEGKQIMNAYVFNIGARITSEELFGNGH
ncbi:MAG: methionyl-tRNA formyltransferase [Candidatus Cloacimonetes bacterium]|nr:methionyl-tRNA formyltransferase [Candidatus Cloacimonadota bacterium]